MTDQQTPMPPTIQIVAAPQPEDEISLRELWERILQGKWMILLVTILFLALASAYIAFSTTVYESKAMVQIGCVAGTVKDRLACVPIANGQQLAIRLKNAYTGLNTVVAAPKTTPNILTLVGSGKSPAQAQSYLQGILKKLIASENGIYNQFVHTRKTQLAQLQDLYQSIVKSRVQINNRQGTDAATKALALLALSQQMSTLAAIQGQIAKVQNALSPVNTYPTEITLQPTYDPKAVQPKKLVILILALFSGLIVGIFVVLLRNAFAVAPKGE
jgi:uncharacterized protein involved in exopolysaccharide biosynthesis